MCRAPASPKPAPGACQIVEPGHRHLRRGPKRRGTQITGLLNDPTPANLCQPSRPNPHVSYSAISQTTCVNYPLEELPGPLLAGAGGFPREAPAPTDPAVVEETDAISRRLARNPSRAWRSPSSFLGASSRITLSTSATSSGSSALVTSSSSMIRGSHGQRPHDRDPLLLAAREPIGILVGLVCQAEPLEQLRRVRLGLRATAQNLSGRERHVAQHRHVREQVERLEDDPDPSSDPVPSTPAPVISSPSRVIRRRHRLEQVDAAQQRRLAGARGADQARRPRARRPRSMPRSTSCSPKSLWSPGSVRPPALHDRRPRAPSVRACGEPVRRPAR